MDKTILKTVTSANGMRGRLYYYKGNFFQPLFLKRKEQERVEKAIRKFIRDNLTLVQSDRAQEGYRDLVQLSEVSHG